MLGVGPTEACRIGEVGSHVPAPCGIRPRWRRPELENGAMNLLHRITGHFEIRRKQAAIHSALARLDARALADLGLEPGDIATRGTPRQPAWPRRRPPERDRSPRPRGRGQRGLSGRPPVCRARADECPQGRDPGLYAQRPRSLHRGRASAARRDHGLAVALARPGPGRPVPAGRAGSARNRAPAGGSGWSWNGAAPTGGCAPSSRPTRTAS